MKEYRSNYPLSEKFPFSSHAPLAVAMALVLDGVDSRFRPGQVMRGVTALIGEGKTLDGAEPAGYEIGRWAHRFMCDDEPKGRLTDDTYFAWVSDTFWEYDPSVVTYTKSEFMALFEDCCRNFVAVHPERREEFAAALAANGMSLVPTADRP